mmetsp:Transcript_102744/g.329437  ORF Transcript_102744/g.329437 Transcript_102744/m.329437 type:complete len:299 (+) Transcript_102744:324-1220(+)
MAWNILKSMPCTQIFKEGDERHPLEVIRFVVYAVSECGALMSVIGSDGLDKKSRLAKMRLLYLVEWHAAVPALTAAFHDGAEAFHGELLKVRGLRGELTRKEVLIVLASSKFASIRRVGEPLLPFGQGAKNGAFAFLGVKQKVGAAASAHYHSKLTAKLPLMEATIARLFPSLPPADLKVSLGDVEPCLCAATVYAGLVRRLRKALGKGSASLVTTDEDAVWDAVESLGAPAGFYAYSRAGAVDSTRSAAPVKRVPYTRLRLEAVPSPAFLRKVAATRQWPLKERGAGKAGALHAPAP